MGRRTGEQQPTRAVAYLRVSTERQADGGTSLESQRTQIQHYAALYGLEIVAWYEDPGTSAKSLRRPGVRAALDDLDSGQADALIVAKLDRLTRSVRDLVNLMDRYFASGRVALLSVGEQVDTRTATGRMVLNVIATISQWERERIGERVRDMHRVKRARGERVGKLTYGYRVGPDGRALEPHPEEQAVIRVMQTLRADGMSFKTIADELTTRGLPARGSRWHATSVRRILTRAA